MSQNRRQFLTSIAAIGSAAALAGCGGGGEDSPPPTRRMWLLNLNPDATSATVKFGDTTVASSLAFPKLTSPATIEYGTYSFSVRPAPAFTVDVFDNIQVDDVSPAMTVYYRNGTSALLGFSPVGITNYFDSGDSLIAYLYDDLGNLLQVTEPIAYGASVAQAPNSSGCQLRLYSPRTASFVYDSGLQFSDGAIVIYRDYAALNQITASGLSYTATTAALRVWL